MGKLSRQRMTGMTEDERIHAFEENQVETLVAKFIVINVVRAIRNGNMIDETRRRVISTPSIARLDTPFLHGKGKVVMEVK